MTPDDARLLRRAILREAQWYREARRKYHRPDLKEFMDDRLMLAVRYRKIEKANVR